MQQLSALLAAVTAALGVQFATTTVGAPVQKPCVAITQTLAFGSRGEQVAQLQKFLEINPSGYFGPLTRSKLTLWQAKIGIVPSQEAPGAGTTGPRTRAALRCTPITPKLGATTTSQRIEKPEQAASAPVLPSKSSGSGGPSTDSTGSPRASSGQAAPSVTVPGCAPFGVQKPPAEDCHWQWQLIADEAGCPAQWDCSDPNNFE